VVTVGDNTKDAYSGFPAAKETLHWPFDPAEARGTDDEKMLFFRRVREEIRDKILGFLK
jgi:arsenate reductase